MKNLMVNSDIFLILETMLLKNSMKKSLYLHKNDQLSALSKDAFETKYPIKSGFGNKVWIEINTGTLLIYGDYGITKFKYEDLSY